MDAEWKKLKLAAPARRALVNAEILKLSDLKKFTRAQIVELHGMGPNALGLLDAAMDAAKISFKK